MDIKKQNHIVKQGVKKNPNSHGELFFGGNGGSETSRSRDNMGLLLGQQVSRSLSKDHGMDTLDLTSEIMTDDQRLAQEWKNMKPFHCLSNAEGLCPLEKDLEATLIPPEIVHMDDIPNWRVLGTNLNLKGANRKFHS